MRRACEDEKGKCEREGEWGPWSKPISLSELWPCRQHSVFSRPGVTHCSVCCIGLHVLYSFLSLVFK